MNKNPRSNHELFAQETVASLTDHFADAFVRESVVHVYDVGQHNDVRKFDADAILFRDIQHKKMDISMFKLHFQCGLGKNQVKYARITITHVCFIALTLARSLDDV